MKRELAWLVWAVVMVSCAKTTQPLPNKNTNWLRACDADAACGEDLSCICGVCTTRCEAARECGAGGDDVACTPVGDLAHCEGAGDERSASICAATCEGDDDCRAYGPHASCRAGACVDDANTTPDAATAPDADDADDAGDAATDAPRVVCEAGRANCNADPADGCEREIPAGEDLPAGPGRIPPGCVETLATEQAAPSSVAIDATYLYWTNFGTFDALGYNDGSVMAVPLVGGPVTTLATGQRYAGSLAVDEDHAYWITVPVVPDRSLNQIMRVPLAGGAVEVFIDDLPSTHGIALDDTYAYYFSSIDDTTNEQALFRATKDGSEPAERLTDGGFGIFDTNVLLQDGMLYWLSDTRIYRVAVDGTGGLEPLAERPDAVEIRKLAIHGDALYWTEGHSRATRLATMPLAGGDPVTLAMLDDAQPTGAATDDAYVYWGHTRPLASDTSVSHGIARSDMRPGKTTALLVDDSLEQALLAVTDTDVYVVAAGSYQTPTGVVLRLPK